MIATDGIPEAWPGLMTREQLCAYLGGICDATLRKVCPVAPVDLGANVYLYRIEDVDAWRRSLALRLPKGLSSEQDAPHQDPPAANDRPGAALDKVRRRLGGRG